MFVTLIATAYSGLPSSAELPGLLWSGATTGAIGGALGVAVVLSLRATGIVNLGVGAIYVFGALVFHQLTDAGLPLAAAAGVTLLGASMLGAAEEGVVLRRLRREPPAQQLLATSAFALVVQGALVAALHPDPVTAPALVEGGTRLGSTPITWAQVIVVVVTLLVAILVEVGLRRSRPGLELTAQRDDVVAAGLMGIDIDRRRIVAFVAVGLICGATGLLAAPFVLIDFASGLFASVNGAIAAILVGGRSPTAAMAAGLAIGMVSAFSARILSEQLAQATVAAILIAVVLALPDRAMGR